MHPTATTAFVVPAPFRSEASSSASTESFLAASTNPHVLTTTVSASSASSTSRNPPSSRRAASSSESTSLRAQPSVSTATVVGVGSPSRGACWPEERSDAAAERSVFMRRPQYAAEASRSRNPRLLHSVAADTRGPPLRPLHGSERWTAGVGSGGGLDHVPRLVGGGAHEAECASLRAEADDAAVDGHHVQR